MLDFRICILGPFALAGADDQVAGGKQQTLLAALAIHCGQTVSAESLVDILWDTNPPPSARTTLRGHIKRLRQSLRRVARGAELVRSMPQGYLLAVDPSTVDLPDFRL